MQNSAQMSRKLPTVVHHTLHMGIADEKDLPSSPPPRKRGRPKAAETLIRVSYHVTPSLMARIDAYWHARGLPSRADTIRKLLEHGLGGP